MKIHRISRRAFLQGAGGAAIAIPFLPSVLPATAQAADGSPMRFAMVYTKYARPVTQWITNSAPLVASADGAYRSRSLSDMSGQISPILAEAYDDVALRKKIAIVRGLDPNCTPYAHNFSFATTCDCGDGKLEFHKGGGRFGYSVDAVLEESPVFYSAPPSVGAIRTVMGVKDEGNYYELQGWSYSMKNGGIQQLDWETDPRKVYDKYFNVDAGKEVDARAMRLGGVSQVVYEDYKRTLNGRRISEQDKVRLDNFMSLLSDIQKNLGSKAVDCSRTAETEARLGGLNSYDDYHDVAMDLEVAALACGTTKIVMHGISQWDPERVKGADGQRWHDIAHCQDELAGVQLYADKMSSSKWHATKFAQFCKKLDAITDTNGDTLLDNTMVMYANEDSSGGHFLMDMPVIVAGAKGKIQTDRIIDYRNMNDPYAGNASGSGGMYWGRPYNNLLITAFKACGLEQQDWTKLPNQDGFGVYDGGYDAARYTKWVSSSERNAPLPGLWIG